MSRRAWATLAFLLLTLGTALLAWAVAGDVLRGAALVGLAALAAFAAWSGLTAAGWQRALWWAAALTLLLLVAIAWISEAEAAGILGLALLIAAGVAARPAFTVVNTLPPADRPQRPVMIYNPRSGGGKAERFGLAEEARRRGIEPIALSPGDDLLALVNAAVAGGADGLAAAGGDGTQALVASVAATHGLPFACIPAGTRNHFALDLGVDREDVVGALDAFVTGRERIVDLATAGDRVFVNNCSLGVYAEAVQHPEYRGAKLPTLLATASTTLSGEGRMLRWVDDSGTVRSSAPVILISNNPYRLGRVLGTGSRPRMDSGRLGIAVIGPSDVGVLEKQWTATEFTVESDGDIPVGVDGEALLMPSPLTFRIAPAALRVRIAPQHPGASPASTLPVNAVDAFRQLWRIATGRPRPD